MTPTSVYNPHRNVPKTGLDYYPTPPAATQVLVDWLSEHFPIDQQTCLEPAAGGGHMVDVLAQRFASVEGRDIADPEQRGWGGHDYLFGMPNDRFDWIITNPPYKLADQFVCRMHDESRVGCAVLARLTFLEGQRRYRSLFKTHPPTRVMVFSERVHMIEGRLATPDDGSPVAACAWFVWVHHLADQPSQLAWIPPFNAQ